jgi:hypothetical protein
MATSAVAALNADPLRTTSGASKGVTAWNATVRTSSAAQNRAASREGIRLSTRPT